MRTLHTTGGWLRFLIAAWIGLTAPLAWAGSQAQAPHLGVELLAQGPLRPGEDNQLALHFVLERGWHIYWQNPGDSGEAPQFHPTLRAEPANAALPAAELARLVQIGALRWPVPERLVSGPVVNFGYADEVTLPMPVQVSAELAAQRLTHVVLSAQVKWLVCADVCIPGSAQLDLSWPLATSAVAVPPTPDPVTARFVAAQKTLPPPLPSEYRLSAVLDARAFHLRLEMPPGQPSERQLRAEFLPLTRDEVDLSAGQEAQLSGTTLALSVPRSEQLNRVPATLRGLLRLSAGEQRRTFEVTVPVVDGTQAASSPAATMNSLAPAAAAAPSTPDPASPPTPSAPPSLGLMLLFALLGGALLNLMPCVFPVLSIKALELVETATSDRRRARGHGLAYTAGVLLSFWLLAGLLIALRYAGQQLGWGFHLQSPRFLVALSGLLFLMGLNLLGVFEVGLGLTQLGQVSADVAARDRRGYFAAFITGVLATVVATPCSAPFMSTALGFALSQPPLLALPIFTALALGLALPYVLLTWLPGLHRLLPRPGAWMETFKQVMGFLLLGTVVWLAWVLAAQVGGIGVVALLAGLLILGVAAWLLRRWSERRAVLLLGVALIGLGAIVPGSLASQLAAPPPTSVAASPGAAAMPASSNELVWEPFSKESLAAHRAAGHAVFLDFTAEWCVSCKVNERLVLQSEAVRRRLRESGMVTMKADWTSYDPRITEALAEFGKSAIPFYAVYSRDRQRPPVELPAILTPGLVLDAIERAR